MADADVLVVGAGISGLAAAHELTVRGARVIVLERAAIGADQSAGLARIFRVAHADPRLAGLAVEALRLWRGWEDRFGRRLVGEEGLVLVGEGQEARAAALEAAGAPGPWIDRAEIAARVPVTGPRPAWSTGLLDPLGGAIRIRRTLHALAAGLDLRIATVTAVADDGDTAAVTLADGSVLRAGHALVCAGTQTGPLVAAAGIDLEMAYFHHVRLTYGPRAGAEVLPTAGLIVGGDGYGLPLGATGRFAMGLHDPGEPVPYAAATADAYAARVRDQHAGWIPRNLPLLDPEPVDEVRCVAIQAPFLDAHEDGFAARRAGRVIAFAGSNLMKFGPLLGDRLARTVFEEDPDAVHPDLTG